MNRGETHVARNKSPRADEKCYEEKKPGMSAFLKINHRVSTTCNLLQNKLLVIMERDIAGENWSCAVQEDLRDPRRSYWTHTHTHAWLQYYLSNFLAIEM